uniref:DUF1835 domain-containing protein n=1 Tax=Magnetococcus massalia (strain MO-1) TaxID=451514 RepID=A0A1S7LID6_MAGMO|nr:Conserved protein of unknown function [Candidatus Magnetococcus massalia]
MNKDLIALNITNGSVAVDLLEKGGIQGDMLSWDDVLYEGPVSNGLDLSTLSLQRAEYIYRCGFGELESINNSFIERDSLLESCNQFLEVTLWFEHDLYDQLQLLQVLSELHRLNHEQVMLVQSDHYLGWMTPEMMMPLAKTKKAVADDLYLLAQIAWQAFRSQLPYDWAKLLQRDTSAMPFLEGAVLRHLEQYPHPQNGLNRTQQQILEAVVQGSSHPGLLFKTCLEREERQFMGDASFFLNVRDLVQGDALALDSGGSFQCSSPSTPKEQFLGQKLMLTSFGQALLNNEEDWIEQRGIERWFGGVHMTSDIYWRWDPEARTLIQ